MVDILVVLVVLGLALAPFLFVAAYFRRRELARQERSATVELVVDEFGVRREIADGRREEIDWPEVREVEVYRTTGGPHAAGGGMIMISGGETRGCLVPLDQLDESGLVEALQRLPGFEMRPFADALEADPPTQILVWRAGGPGNTLTDT